jgi:hypothetical protein
LFAGSADAADKQPKPVGPRKDKEQMLIHAEEKGRSAGPILFDF